jgi:hypothetical protein
MSWASPAPFGSFKCCLACLVVASAVVGCRAGGDAGDSVAAGTAVHHSLDSCGGLVGRQAAPDTVGRPGITRTAANRAGAVHAFRLFSLYVPDGVRVTTTDSGFGGASLSWPGCVGCRLGVAIQVDSGIGLDARIARMVAAQRTIDSINHDPKTVIHEFDDIDGPPQPFVTPLGRGYLIEDACGDCAARTLLLWRSGYIAEIGLGVDDDVPDPGRHLCEMTVIGKTFAWRP